MIQKTINVETNDETKRFIVFTLKINLITYLEVNPEFVNISTFKGEEGKISINIKSPRYINFKIKKIEIDNPELKYKIEPPKNEIEKKEKGYTLTLIAPPNLEPKIYSGKITIRTNIKKQLTAEINYRINIQDFITVNPPIISLNVSNKIYKIIALEDIPIYEKNSNDSPIIGVLKQNEEAFFSKEENGFAQIRFEKNKNGFISMEKTKKIYGKNSTNVLVQKHKGEPLEIIKVVCDLPFVKVEYKLSQTNFYTITLSYEGEMEKKTYNGNLTIYTNDKEQPVIKKPIVINVGMYDSPMPQIPKNVSINKKVEIKNTPQKLEENK